jgi:5-enolpyruvylshikimate-3-phosphate synthase
MALTLAALSIPGETVIEGAECAKVSYPSFFEDMLDLGADIDIK